MSQTVEAQEHAKQQARTQLESIVELMEAIEQARAGEDVTFEGEEMDEADLEERARELPLSALVRSGWDAPGSEMALAEYELLLCTGGPAVRIRGDLSECGEPTSARLESQDWFTSWERFAVSSDEREALMEFVSLFWFGE